MMNILNNLKETLHIVLVGVVIIAVAVGLTLLVENALKEDKPEIHTIVIPVPQNLDDILGN